MKGYYNGNYYMGYLPSTGEYFRFDSDSAYEEYYLENEEKD